MTKRVIIIASGETERRALPYLVSHLTGEGVSVDQVLIPPRNRAMNVENVESLIWTEWYSNVAETPDKFVVLVDTDRDNPQEVMGMLSSRLPLRMGDEIAASLDSRTIEQRSPSFRCFLETVLNGDRPMPASGC